MPMLLMMMPKKIRSMSMPNYKVMLAASADDDEGFMIKLVFLVEGLAAFRPAGTDSETGSAQY